MKKKYVGLIAFLLVVLTVTLVACSPKTSHLEPLKKQGIVAYNFTEKEKSLIKAMGIKEQDFQMLSFNAPSGAKGIATKVYRLGNNKTWEEIDKMSVSFTVRSSVVDSKGTLSMDFSKDNAINFVVAADTGLVEYETKGIQSSDNNMLSAWSFVNEADGELNTEINKEIPVAIFTYSDEGGSVGSSLQSFYNTSAFENSDYVQAVTVTFTDKNE